ncbi:Hypothetical_protein [Hexamita inflata]|uniref:Hypothetical_protein n=1 Tax=Hexamita inflata TaxID=28002 RepID=A0AA86PLG9_9EUKA|nr:Hypothetical protein HINF_LOCUS28047 [Hexamita inflata]
MQQNQEIKSQEDLLSHFGSSKQLEILDSEQMKNLLEMDIPPEVWEDASNKNLFSVNQEFVQETKEFKFNYFNFRKIEHFIVEIYNISISYHFQLTQPNQTSKIIIYLIYPAFPNSKT